MDERPVGMDKGSHVSLKVSHVTGYGPATLPF